MRGVFNVLVGMGDITIISCISGALVAFSLYMIQRIHSRIDRLQEELGDVRVETAKTQQENKELQTHIKRIDKNIDDLFLKMDELVAHLRNK